ncbi:MAG TPA: putative molybdenum carrier protein [Coriobacteriia bacterium]
MISSIRSGGQSGVDRAALDCAIALGLRYEGWCPAGGWAEDYPVPPGLFDDYPFLTETPSSDPDQRTEWNVRDSDATLVLACGETAGLSPGTLLTASVAERSGKPCLEMSVFDDPRSRGLAGFLAFSGGRPIVLNVAGPRESECPGAYAAARAFLMAALRP